MYRRRQRRLLALALEREYLLESAEAELATGRPMRRETLYRLAGVDAEAASLGGGGGLADAVRRKTVPNNNRGSRMRANSGGRGYGKQDDFNDIGYSDGGYGDGGYGRGGGGGGGGGYPEGFDMDARRGSASVSPHNAQHRGRQGTGYSTGPDAAATYNTSGRPSSNPNNPNTWERNPMAEQQDAGRNLHSFTFRLNLSRVCHKKTPCTP
jgi:hypothetical protein